MILIEFHNCGASISRKVSDISTISVFLLHGSMCLAFLHAMKVCE